MVSHRIVDNIAVLEIPGVVESGKIQETVRALVNAGKIKIAVNLEHVSFIESSGLGALVAAYKICDDKGGNIVFFKLQPYVQKLVELTRLDRVLKLYDTEEEALAVLQ